MPRATCRIVKGYESQEDMGLSVRHRWQQQQQAQVLGDERQTQGVAAPSTSGSGPCGSRGRGSG